MRKDRTMMATAAILYTTIALLAISFVYHSLRAVFQGNFILGAVIGTAVFVLVTIVYFVSDPE